ncbi:hypothetical protein F5B18DRAFT_611588 [Nemania serpens]|nr:hypothetical protein F5B18DRAFT_611588 [Nemania serpens]
MICYLYLNILVMFNILCLQTSPMGLTPSNLHLHITSRAVMVATVMVMVNTYFLVPRNDGGQTYGA